VNPNGSRTVLTYKAMYKFAEGGVHAEVLDFPGAITCADTLKEARELLASALSDMAETHAMKGRALPLPNPSATSDEADLEEPIHLLLTGANVVAEVPVRCSGRSSSNT
jgi:predicted RNase H-like HicB family nuclease